MKTEEKDGKGEDKQYVPEFVVVEGEANKGAKEAADGEDEVDNYSDERLSASQRREEDIDSGDDTEVVADDGSETAEELEKKRAKRRAERKAQKQRQTLARTRDKQELSYLRIRNEQIERRLLSVEKNTNARATQTDLAVVEGRIQQLTAAQAECDVALAAAIEANNGTDAVKLQRAQTDLREGLNRLTAHRDKLKTAPVTKAEEREEDEEEQQERGQQDPGFRVSPGAIKNANVFAQRHPWVNLQGGDQDSNIVKVLDAAVLEEGYQPATKEYWQELESRMETVLPHRFKDKGQSHDADDDDDDEAPAARRSQGKKSNGNGGPRMPSNSQNRGGSGKQFYLSAERKQAMIEAGVWDDPAARDRQLRQYRKWDQENAGHDKNGR